LPGLGSPADAVGSEAVALFADRARSADPHFAFDEHTTAGVARLVTRLDGMPLAIELAAARVESLGIGQLLDRLDDRFTLLAGADRLAAPRQRSLAATVEWSYPLLDEQEQRVFRALSVFPAEFTLAAAEVVAGEAAGPAVLHLVDCSLLVPPRPGPDGNSRYSMLETLRGYGARLLAGAGEHDVAAAALAECAVRVAEQAAAGMTTIAGEPPAVRRLDAEDATMGQVLAWAVEHDLDMAARLVTALGLWWTLRGRLAGQGPLLRELAERAEPGSEGWCAAQFWLAHTALDADGLPQSLQRCAAIVNAIGDREPSRILADCLHLQSVTLSKSGPGPRSGRMRPPRPGPGP
jgi:predicted ATPase